MKFDLHGTSDAPEASRSTLESVEKAYGFVPNLFRVFAASPAALEAYVALDKALQKSGLDPIEQQVVVLAVSAENGCGYCMAAHSSVATRAKMPAEVLDALRRGGRLPKARHEALRAFALSVIGHRGWVPEAELEAFLRAGFERRHVLDVLTIIAMKTLSNYTNHLAGTPLDSVFAAHEWHGKPEAA
jgi:uncharacterized peroxidase-related enzyme